MISSFRIAPVAFAALVCLPFLSPAQQAEENDPVNAVVKLEVITQTPDFIHPWKSDRGGGDGSGVVIGPGRILTCAHCVADSTHIRIRKQEEDSIYQGTVEFIDNDCDLALVRVEDAAFMADITPMKIGETPALQDTVVAVGYPMGGVGISFTRGIVSRIEDITYSQSWLSLLGIQVDAAINPGNSGGPVVDVRTFDVVGIAFQGKDKGESLGYMVPPDIIRHFLKDIEDGRVDGFADQLFAYGSLESESARRYLKMDAAQTGVLVEDVSKSMGENSLRAGDVLLEVDGYKVANNGNIRIEGNERRSFQYPVYLRQIGETVPVKALRDGAVVETGIPAVKQAQRTRRFMYDQVPDYYVFGGYVFSTVSYNFLLQKVRLHDNVLDDKESPDDEPVVVTDVLADATTEGYLGMYGSLVRSVNGEKVRNMKHLVELIEGCKDGFLCMMVDHNTDYDTPLYLDAKLLREATPRILERYRIPADRSKDLR